MLYEVITIGVVMTSLKSTMKAGDHGSTFGGNYLSATAAKTVVSTLSAHKESGTLDETMLYFENALQSFFEANGTLFTAHVGFGMMRGLRVRDAETLANIIALARKEGILVLKAGSYNFV